MKVETTKIKLSSEDWGWVAVNIGMGIGAGIVFLPVAAGLVGLWTFLLAVLIAYPALYQFQRLFINTLAGADHVMDYPTTIREYLGKKWGISLGIIYFVMLMIWLFVYSQTITNDSACYIQAAGVTRGLLSANPLYGLLLIIFLVFVAFISKTLLLNFSKLLVVVVLSILTLLGLMIIPYWDFQNVQKVASCSVIIENTIIMLPFAMTSILFLPSLSPTVIYVRSKYEEIPEARAKALKIMNRSFFILAGIVFFFAFSCTMAIKASDARQAFQENTSFLVVMSETIPGKMVPVMGVILDVFAVMTSFFGVLLGLHEACVGLVVNLFLKDRPRKQINMKKLSAGVVGFIITTGWLSTILNLPILEFTRICSPIFAVIGCFIPVLLIYSSDRLKTYRGPQAWMVCLTGILLVISPFLLLGIT